MNDDVSKAIDISIYKIIKDATRNAAYFSIHEAVGHVTLNELLKQTENPVLEVTPNYNAIHDTVMLATHNPIILGIQEATTINKI